MEPRLNKRLRANLFLFTAALVWGSTFVFQKNAMAHMSPSAYTGARFLLGGLALAPFAFYRAQKLLAGNLAWGLMVRWWAIGGLLSGSLICLGVLLQQYGLVTTTAGKAGFITGLYVIFVPLIGRALGERLDRGIAAGIALAVVGLYLLSFTGAFEIGAGDLLVLISAVVWAGHVISVGWLSPKMDSLILATGQALVCGLFALTMSLAIDEAPTVAGVKAAWLDLLWGSLFSVAGGFTLQVMGQKDAPPTSSAIIMQLEAVVAALVGWLWLNEIMTPRMFLGAALMLAGMLVSQLYPLLKRKPGGPPGR